MTERLIKDHGLIVVGDHPDYGNDHVSHERGLKFPQRVDEILINCSGLVAIFPRKPWPQTTTSLMFLELMLAVRHRLPILLFCEEGVDFKISTHEDSATLSFGPEFPDSSTFTLEDLERNPFPVTTWLRKVRSLTFRIPNYLGRPIYLSRNPVNTPGLSGRVSSAIEEFASCLEDPEQQGTVFNIAPFPMEEERRIIARAVFEETGLVCVNGSDRWCGAPFARHEIVDKISAARFVIADFSDLRPACVFETGVAIGSKRDTFLISKTPHKKIPFGPDKHILTPYSDMDELDRAVRQYCRPYRRKVFNLEYEQTAKLSISAGGETRKKVAEITTFLIHGIGTQGEWQEMVRDVLEKSGKIEVIPIKYGFFDVLRFWFPFRTRAKAINTLRWKLEGHSFDGYETVIIAHSFGSYAISRLLAESTSFRPSRILFCGSIVRQNYRWDQIENCPRILNDCGAKDFWPVLATAFSWGYGPSGTFGFGTPGIHDRFHNFTHSRYFDRDFVARYWDPWIRRGEVVRGLYTRKRTPYWMSILTIQSFGFVFLSSILLVAVLIFFW